MKRAYYSETVSVFLATSTESLLGALAANNAFSLELTQRKAWMAQIEILRESLEDLEGHLLFEFSIPRMGKRIDVVLILKNVVFVLEFKIGEKEHQQSGLDQVMDYCLDLKNFHETSHSVIIAPILIATDAKNSISLLPFPKYQDNIFTPIRSNRAQLREKLQSVLDCSDGPLIDPDLWLRGRYSPTPTIIEAALALYNQHSVEEISRNDAAAANLTNTSIALAGVILQAKQRSQKAICFVTGVPGAGKTLVGLNIATQNVGLGDGISSVFLSGNGPLVAILREALTEDKVKREKERGLKLRKGEARSTVKVFIQNVHHFRDECLLDKTAPPFDHVAIFDEAQRAWNQDQTSKFMATKKGDPNFMFSEPEFLISCLDRHKDWAVVICLVGGGQEINTGEAGIAEWFDSLNRSFPDWNVYVSSQINESEYSAGEALKIIERRPNLVLNPNLHLSMSMRSFRAENVSLFVKCLLDQNVDSAKRNLEILRNQYPIVITRSIVSAKNWVKEKSRGNERYGIVVSSQAQRLKPYAIDVKAPINPVHWFLKGKEDIRSSFFLEDVATEFHVQGLELDWVCVAWDADFRYAKDQWETFSFVGHKWQKIKKNDRKQYLKNAYRVLLTRARQGMVILIPEGDSDDKTRCPSFYDSTFEYLQGLGLEVV
jgi:hypothetical protein